MDGERQLMPAILFQPTPGLNHVLYCLAERTASAHRVFLRRPTSPRTPSDSEVPASLAVRRKRRRMASGSVACGPHFNCNNFSCNNFISTATTSASAPGPLRVPSAAGGRRECAHGGHRAPPPTPGRRRGRRAGIVAGCHPVSDSDRSAGLAASVCNDAGLERRKKCLYCIDLLDRSAGRRPASMPAWPPVPVENQPPAFDSWTSLLRKGRVLVVQRWMPVPHRQAK